MKTATRLLLALAICAALAAPAIARTASDLTATLIVHSQEGGAHIYIDGRLRAKMDVTSHEIIIDGIESGGHSLRITDFTELEVWWEGPLEIKPGFTARAVAEPGQFTIYNKPPTHIGTRTPTHELPNDMVGYVQVRSNEQRPLSIFIDLQDQGMVGRGAVIGPLDVAAGEHYLRAVDPNTGGLVCSGLIDVRPGATLVIAISRGAPLSSPSRPRAVIPGF
ncbi:MAG: hypothetical protein P9M14_07465 [Candidatus Alcyoniella australis]|nr:hypothetical protein [Candidatus Alcyoniella australis]